MFIKSWELLRRMLPRGGGGTLSQMGMGKNLACVGEINPRLENVN